MPQSTARLSSCLHCGQIQYLPAPLPGHYLTCARCFGRINPASASRNRLSAVFAVCALVFYVPAMMLPMLRIERLGHIQENSLLGGVASLFSQGHGFIALLILFFSVLLPPAKLIALWLLAVNGVRLPKQKALLYHAVELFGRWSMLDVMLVALLVAFVKLSDLLIVTPGHGLIAFAGMVLLNILASLCFSPISIWQQE